MLKINGLFMLLQLIFVFDFQQFFDKKRDDSKAKTISYDVYVISSPFT